MNRGFRVANMPIRIITILAIIFFSSLPQVVLPKAAHAQASGWAPVQSIPGYERDNLPPYMVADQNNTVHAFTSNNFGDRLNPDRVIVYSKWQLDQGWSYPTDILASPIRKQARVQGAFLDTEGFIHVIYFGGDDKGAEIFYSKAPALSAENSQAWTKPRSIGKNAIAPDYAALVGDDDGTLVAVYSGDVDRIGLYEVHSMDGGETWSEPEAIFLTFSNQWQPSDLNMFMGKNGRVHAVWNVTNARGDNVSGYYTNADVGLWSWLEPFELDENRELGIAIPNVIEHQNAVWIIYNNGLWDEVAPVQWTRISYDNGLTWSNPVRPFSEHIGRNGNIAFALDSREQLHVMFGQRTYKEGENRPTHGMWYSTRINENWSSLVPVTQGYSELDDVAEVGFDPYDARAIISQGNYLLLTWRTDPGLSNDGVWYSYRRLDAPSLPVVPLSVPAAATGPTATSAPSAVAVAVTPGAEAVAGDSDGTSASEVPISPIAMTETAIARAANGEEIAGESDGIGASGGESSLDESSAGGSSAGDSGAGDSSAAKYADLGPPETTEPSPASALVFGVIPAALFTGLMVVAVRYFQKRRTF